MKGKRIRLLFAFLRAVLAIICLDLSQGATNLGVSEGISSGAVGKTAVLFGAAGLLLLGSVIVDLILLRRG